MKCGGSFCVLDIICMGKRSPPVREETSVFIVILTA